MPKAGRFFLLWVALVLLPVPAFAQDVLVVRPSQSDAALFEAYGRLRAELILQGFQVQTLPSTVGPINTDTLALEAERRNAFAAIALERDADGTTAEVHLVDRVTGKRTTRRLKISKAKDGPMLLAIRAADLLRASLLELEPGETAPDDVVGAEKSPPPKEVVRFSRELPKLQISAGAVGLFHTELGASFGANVAFHYRPLPRLALGIEFGGPAFGGEFRIDDNSASVREEFALARGTFNLGTSEPGQRFEWGPLLECGVVHVAARGEVSPPLVSTSSDVWTFGMAGGAVFEVFFNETLSLAGELKALGLVPQPVVAIGTQTAVPMTVQGSTAVRMGVSF